MKKIILLLLLSITTTANVFAEELPDYPREDSSNAFSPFEGKEDDFNAEILERIKSKRLPPEKPKQEDSKLAKERAFSDKVAQINLMKSDEEKVKAWAKLNRSENYVIINKKNCTATVYDNEGRQIDEFEIGIGREIGDDFNDTLGLMGKAKNTTPAGEYTLIKNIINPSAYGDITLSLGDKANKASHSKKVVALHKVPKFRQQDRLKKFNDGNLANNRMSHGCINFLEKDFKELTKYIHGGLKVYVLPEEADNQLILEKNDKGEFELLQAKY